MPLRGSFLVLTTASSPLRPQLMHDLGSGMFALQLTSGPANARPG